VALNNARNNDKLEELEQVLNDFTEEWNRGSEDDARFEQEYIVAVGKKTG
jgi:hypothetical protein